MRAIVTVKVPATTSNLGPGFDCLGMALGIWNTARFEVGGTGFEIRGEGAGELTDDASNLVHESFRVPFDETGRDVPQVGIVCENEVPLARGLGSSSTAVVAGLIAGNEVCGKPFSIRELLEFAYAKEGHPDNATPALLGGFQVVVRHGDRLATSAVPIPDDLRAVIFVPNVPMPTAEARSVLPTEVSMADAVFNMGRIALLVSAFSSGDYANLVVATEDRLHQPARQTIFPPMKNIFRAAIGAGALGVFLSGAGSSVLALAREREMSIGYEMAEAASKSGVDGSLKITRPTSLGAHVVEND